MKELTLKELQAHWTPARIKRLRRRRRESQKVFGLHLGYSNSHNGRRAANTVSALESGAHKPGLGACLKMEQMRLQLRGPRKNKPRKG